MNETRRHRRRKRKLRPSFVMLVAVLVALLVGLALLLTRCGKAPEPEMEETTEPVVTTEATEPTVDPYAYAHTPLDRLVVFARLNNLSLTEDWPEPLLELLEKNPDAEEFVRDYPFRPEEPQTIDLSDQVGTGQVPLLFQWDKRWGYSDYGGQMMALTGCGPTCMSMACLYYLEDAKYTPRYMADYAIKNGYYTKGVGTAWAFFSKGAKKLGLKIEAISPNPTTIMSHLEKGRMVVCAMGPGIFTESGHFILLVGAKDGKAIIHDPNSKTNSEKLWNVSKFSKQISMLWVIKGKA